MATPPLVIIEWRDAVTDIGWRNQGEVEPTQLCWSIGVIAGETEHHVTVGGTWGIDSSGEIQTNNRVTIPKSWIVSRKVVTIKRENRSGRTKPKASRDHSPDVPNNGAGGPAGGNQ